MVKYSWLLSGRDNFMDNKGSPVLSFLSSFTLHCDHQKKRTKNNKENKVNVDNQIIEIHPDHHHN
ncbi:hypothetical protein DERP_009460 [Dermatophagoides pteronyssinus]|uniref:Uncharacterized protein n=1 Tax=Dermatophagoides pteronyssinus TaxID=6956 RepID=A0ABQ8IUI0_DERPT|nr:hypothetical protein DERP_009460 [Dermatophagoides pteronyssinus]